jgi:hemolysin III
VKAQNELHAPLLHDEEWANALIHASGALAAVLGAVIMARASVGQPLMTTFCCLVFVLSAIAVFSASALSHHLIYEPGLLRRLRAWDQGLIYVMISGTYTPLIWRFSDDLTRYPLLIAVWVAAAVGFYSKVVKMHRINSMNPISYLMLGWLPALGLIGNVPWGLLGWMLAGGMIYVFGVSLLLNDKKRKYLHAAWHVCVIVAATCHYCGVYQYVAAGS